MVIHGRLRGRRPERALAPPVWWFVGGYGLSAVGTGLCYPFLAIYLLQVRGMSVPAVALLLLVLAGAAVPLSVAGGRLCDRGLARWMSMGALVVQATGWLVLAAAPGSGTEVLAVLLAGAGTGLFLPTVVPILHRLAATEQARARAFAVRYLVMNAGLGVGAAIAAVALISAAGATYRWLFAADAVSCLLYALIIAARVPVPGAEPAEGQAASSRGTRFRPSLNQVLLLVAQLVLVTFGLAQVESGVPLMIRTRLGGSSTLVGVLYCVATLVIVLGQMPVSRLVERVHKTRALIAMSGMWALAWLLGYAAAGFGGWVRIALLVAMMATFSLGECAYSPAFYTLVARLAPAAALGRSSGAAWATYQLGSTIGPPLAVFLVSSRVSLWLVLAVAAVLAASAPGLIDYRMHAGRRGSLRPVSAHPAQT